MPSGGQRAQSRPDRSFRHEAATSRRRDDERGLFCLDVATRGGEYACSRCRPPETCFSTIEHVHRSGRIAIALPPHRCRRCHAGALCVLLSTTSQREARLISGRNPRLSPNGGWTPYFHYRPALLHRPFKRRQGNECRFCLSLVVATISFHLLAPCGFSCGVLHTSTTAYLRCGSFCWYIYMSSRTPRESSPGPGAAEELPDGGQPWGRWAGGRHALPPPEGKPGPQADRSFVPPEAGRVHYPQALRRWRGERSTAHLWTCMHGGLELERRHTYS